MLKYSFSSVVVSSAQYCTNYSSRLAAAVFPIFNYSTHYTNNKQPAGNMTPAKGNKASQPKAHTPDTTKPTVPDTTKPTVPDTTKPTVPSKLPKAKGSHPNPPEPEIKDASTLMEGVTVLTPPDKSSYCQKEYR